MKKSNYKELTPDEQLAYVLTTVLREKSEMPIDDLNDRVNDVCKTQGLELTPESKEKIAEFYNAE